MIRSAYRNFTTSSFFNHIFFRSGKSSSKSVWFIEIDPKAIKYISLIPENSSAILGKKAYSGVCNGWWDYFRKPFNTHSHYKTVDEILNSVPFEHTTVYRKVKQKRIKPIEAINICNKLERIISVLSNKDYLSQYELKKLNEMWWLGDVQVPLHEMIVGMDRNGEFVRMAGGKHRLAVAQHLGIKQIPVILSLYHENAMDNLPAKRRLVKGNPEDFRPFSLDEIHS